MDVAMWTAKQAEPSPYRCWRNDACVIENTSKVGLTSSKDLGLHSMLQCRGDDHRGS